ncbi:MAG: Hint domain-containing protein [Litoreibacter sp.]|uniref:Hint domain-containing protein n=1 Tax=Litoreibacter sp. TaxID=1969459 RepID=UPI003298579E
MVAVSFLAFDNDNFVVTSSSSSGIVGNGVINNSSTPDGTIFAYSGGSAEVITLDDTGGDVAVFEDDSAASHVITDGGNLVANGQTVEAESFIFLQALDANGVATGPVITITVFSQGGAFSDVWGLSSDTELVSGTSYVKTGGNNLGSSTYGDFVTCFAKGTLIDTPNGPKLIENLKPGDLVTTRNDGAQPIRWAGKRRVLGRGKFAPIRIATGALSNSETLWVSPEHRMMVEGPMVELICDTSSALVAAKLLVGMPGITQENVAEITYHHLLFNKHQIILGAGCWSESFFLAINALSGLDHDAQRELQEIFPELAAAQADFGHTAEIVLKKHEAALLRRALTSMNIDNGSISVSA